MMRNNMASITAEMVTFARAVDSMKSSDERVCNDPYAKHFINLPFQFVLKSAILRKSAVWYITELRGFYGFIGTIALRVRFIDDCVIESIDNGIRQIVILGAGYDSRAYRFPLMDKQIRFFEIDHPETQKAKIKKVKTFFGALPDHVTYCKINFETDRLDTVLLNAGYKPDIKTLFIWEGVSYYVSEDTIDKTLSFVTTNACKGSSIVFDYIFKAMIDGCYHSKKEKEIKEKHIQIGEPLIFGIHEDGVNKFLIDRGFSHAEDYTSKMLEAKYLSGKRNGIRAYPFFGFVHAHV